MFICYCSTSTVLINLQFNFVKDSAHKTFNNSGPKGASCGTPLHTYYYTYLTSNCKIGFSHMTFIIVVQVGILGSQIGIHVTVIVEVYFAGIILYKTE